MTGDAFAVAELGGCVGINCAVFLAGSLQLFGCALIFCQLRLRPAGSADPQTYSEKDRYLG